MAQVSNSVGDSESCATRQEMTNHTKMTPGRSVIDRGAKPLLVIVIASLDDIARAIRLRRQPDFFELRLDALSHDLQQLEASFDKIRAPLIITARHPFRRRTA